MLAKDKWHDSRWLWILLGLCIPAFLLCLGDRVFIEDESIRALVALEMDLSGNFIVPTLNGDYYYAKPPLYNWIIWLSFTAFGIANEWTARFPTILFLFLFGFSIYYHGRKYLAERTAVLSAVLFVTCGRVLFWESMLALIDIAYSLVTYTAFMVLYREFKRQRYGRLYAYSYALTAIGFLMKGFPSLLFQGLTLIAVFVLWRRVRKLFTWHHLAGIGIFTLIVGGYYLAYHNHHAVQASFDPLLDQATRRTILRFSALDVLKHFFSFPFEVIYHFLPWTILIVYLLKRSAIRHIWQHDFLKYCVVVFAVNIVVYWLSPQVYARYLLMLIPLMFMVLVHLYHLYRNEKDLWQHRFSRVLFLTMGIAVLLILIVSWVTERGAIVTYHHWKYGACALLMIVVLSSIWRSDKRLLLKFALLLLIARIAFNWIIMPGKQSADFAEICKSEVIDFAQRTKTKDVYLFRNSKMDYTSSFYLARERGQITQRRQGAVDPQALYLVDTMRIDTVLLPSAIQYRFPVRERRRHIFAIRGGPTIPQ